MGNSNSTPSREGGGGGGPNALQRTPAVSTANASEAEVCPVDERTREAWLAQARKTGESLPHPISATQSPILAGESCDSSQMDQKPTFKAPSALQTLLKATGMETTLATDRVISTIPRATATETLPAASTVPANNEIESGRDQSGKWIYPSEKMFFEAMRRKNHDPKAEDMRTIVPIHNAVNERAWGEILAWERGKGGESCGGPRLVSFSGLSKDLTPKARLNTLLGYHAPFDRHDWVVDRCGTRVDYVIDFYAGKDEGRAGKSLNFYLDVRPKLNTWEGWKLRAEKLVGL